MPFESPNHTQVPNDLFDSILCDIGYAELKVTLAAIRKTLGWQKRSDKISLSQMEKMTGLSRYSILAGAEAAEKRGTLTRIYDANITEWVVNLVDQPEKQLVKLVNQTGQPTSPELVKLVNPQNKRNKEKEKNSGGRKERPPRALTPLQQEQKHLEQVFAELSGIPFESANKIWHITTQRWIKSANGRSEEILRTAFAEHSKSGLDTRGPQSIDYKFWAVFNQGNAQKGLPEL